MTDNLIDKPTENSSFQDLSGNRGEWSEIYIFLSLASDGKLYAADSDANRMPDTYLDIIKIIREEIANQIYEYHPGDIMTISLNGQPLNETIEKQELLQYKNIVWTLINGRNGNSLRSPETSIFLDRIHIHKLKAPSSRITNYFGGTPDIALEVADYRTNIVSIMAFSCKSPKSSLFNASADNTNFIFKINGNITDEEMNAFNSMWKIINKKNGPVQTIATGRRMQYLKDNNFTLEFVKPAKDTAKRNLTVSGGQEMPQIVAEMLRHYFYDHNGAVTGSEWNALLQHLVATDPANYGFDDLESIYKSKICKLLYDMFTGMRMAKPWNSENNASGGYVFVKRDGEVLVYHSTIIDTFKEFLFQKTGLEGCDNQRHRCMQIYKENNEYYIKLPMQVRSPDLKTGRRRTRRQS